MINIASHEIIKFKNDGFIIIKNSSVAEEIAILADAVTAHAKYFFDDEFCLGDPIKSQYNKKIGECYKTLRYLPELLRLAASSMMIEFVRNLGLDRPCVMNANNMRIDPPDNRALFHWHQDTTYLLGSTNAVTIWIPLTRADQKRGSIELIPGSHKSGLFPFYFPNGTPAQKSYISPRDLYLVKEPAGDSLILEADPGDLVIFYQMLLHRSTPNFSDHPRVTAQLRYSDFTDAKFKIASYPFGDQTNIAHVPSYLELVKD
jgi:ectoine hydroxylase-related dioxygenase (phytanoyl-CoA dioxygenase family)